nr:immunoglobulin light chain junction region [Macaca mulatta]
CQKYNDLPYSF